MLTSPIAAIFIGNMKILFLSDIHSGKDTNYPDVGGAEYVNTYGSQFPKLFSKLSDEMGKVDLVVNLGDAIADESAEKDAQTYKDFIQSFASSPVPVKHVIGNHDARWLTREQLCEIADQPKNYFSFDLGEYHHIILDARFDGYPFTMGSEQLVWLKEDLAATRLPTIAYLHYPADEQDMSKNYYFKGQNDRVFVKEKIELRNIFEESKKVCLVMSGHTHFFQESTINGIRYVTAPSFTENDGIGNPCGAFMVISLVSANEITVESKHV